MPTFNATNPVAVGLATKKEHYDRAFDNTLALKNDHFLRQVFRGVRMRTHPDADLAASRVYLNRAEEIVLDDGFRSQLWNDLVANLAASGAGGLDTGSEAASTWYEIHAIRKSSDGTQNLLLHKAKDYFLDEELTVGEDGSHSLRRANTPLNTKLAQSFQVTNAGPLEFVDVKLIRAGAVAAGTVIHFSIHSDNAGAPGTLLATSDKMDASLVSTTAQWMRFVFRTPATLAASTTYWLVFDGNYTASDTVNIAWRADTTAATYANGAKATFNGSTWTTDTDDDFVFKIYITRNDILPTMPTGYDQICRLGYVYNDASSNLVPFVAQDRMVSPGKLILVSTGAAMVPPTLTSLAAFIPPVPVAVSLGVWTNSLGGGNFVAAPVPGGYAPATARAGDGGTRLYATGDVSGELQPILTEFQGAYISESLGGTPDVWVGVWEW